MEQICIESRELILIILGLSLNFYHILDHPLQDNSIMQEIVNTCISVCTVVFIIVSTVLVAILSIILVMIKNLVLTQELRNHIKMVKKIRESDWESEPPTADT